MRVLIVDHNRCGAESAALLLRAWRHEVEIAPTGHAALVAARRAPPDVALVRLELPDMEGGDLARRLRASPRSRGAFLVAVAGARAAAPPADGELDGALVRPVEYAALRTLLAELQGGATPHRGRASRSR